MSGTSDAAEKADPLSPRLLPVPGSSENPVTASPRSSSSADPLQSPRSPFLHNLHHRFRKGSVASSSVQSSDASTAGAPTEPVDKEEAARTARRFLLATIRNDWQWPPPVDSDEEDGVLRAETRKKNDMLSKRDPIAWRTREEGSSDIDLDSDESPGGKRRRRSSRDPYKFENPDSIAASVAARKLRQKRKIEDEMDWNEGLKVWSERRDAWTGAMRTKPPQKSPDEDELEQPNGAEQSSKRRALSITQIIGRNPTAAKSSEGPISSAGDDGENIERPPPPEKTSSSTTQTTSVSSSPYSTSTGTSALDADPNGPYLPVYSPLFPSSHTLRARIKPPAYPTIYSKVVLQSLTPNVPIPLTHMIGALVDGWKAEGNWPPQAAAQEAAAKFHNSRGEGAFAKWRRDQEEKRRLKRVSAGIDAGTHGHGILKDVIPLNDGDVERKGFRKSLSGAVRKVFGMQEGEEDSDGGLERMGVKFVDDQDIDADIQDLAGMQGLMQEAKEAMDDNIVLNRGLVEEKA